MSQLVGKHHNGNTIRFGLDHALGWFYSEENAAGDEVVALDQGPFTPKQDRLNAARLIELLQANLTRGCLQRLQPAINNIAMDLDPGQPVEV